MRRPVVGIIAAIALLTGRAVAVPVTEKTPAIESPETTRAHTADFLFSHHFRVIVNKVVNVPTFMLGIGIFPWLSVGAMYSTNSDVGRDPNEFQPFGKIWMLREASAFIDLGFVGAYNSAANSGDGAITVRRSIGPVLVLASVRGFTAGYGFGGATLAAAGGGSVKLTRHFRLVGDVSHVLAAHDWSLIRSTSDRFGYSAGIAFDIPQSPHSMSLYTTNITTHTLQGSSRGSPDFQIGFEFDIPFDSARRWGQIFVPPPEKKPAPPAEQPAAAPEAARGVVDVTIRDYAYSPAEIRVAPGTTVRWVNTDDVVHTVTAESNAWDSGDIAPNGVFTRRFDEPGRHPYVCTLHENMQGVVVVEGR